jgi:hypothetical protein
MLFPGRVNMTSPKWRMSLLAWHCCQCFPNNIISGVIGMVITQYTSEDDRSPVFLLAFRLRFSHFHYCQFALCAVPSFYFTLLTILQSWYKAKLPWGKRAIRLNDKGKMTIWQMKMRRKAKGRNDKGANGKSGKRRNIFYLPDTVWSAYSVPMTIMPSVMSYAGPGTGVHRWAYLPFSETLNKSILCR